MLLTFLKNIFHDKLLQDDRQPIITFDNPFGGNNSYGLLAPSSAIWIQFAVAMLIQVLISIILAIPMYHLIIKKRGTMTSLLVGFGGLIPLTLYVPLFFIETFDVQNLAIIMGGVCGIAINGTLCCLEAMYGFTPPSVGISLGRYCSYFGLTFTELEIDPVTTHYVRNTLQSTLRKLKEFTVSYLLTGLLLSFLVQCSFFPFNSPIPVRESSTTDVVENISNILNHIHPGHIMNNLFLAALTSVVLYFGATAQNIVVSVVTGIETKEIADHPLSKSQSPSDFWSRRWNISVGGHLKRGIFKPVRTYYSKAIAAIATFLVSGLFHEYIIFILACARKEDDETFFWTPNYGNQMSFFAWNGAVLIFESLYGSAWIFQWMKHRLPQPIITSLILLTVLPIAHWFTHEYLIVGVYKDFILFVPLIVQL